MQQIYSRTKSKTKKYSHKKKRIVGKKNIIQIAGDGENTPDNQPNQSQTNGQEVPQETQPETQETTENVNTAVINNSASVETQENAGNGIGLNQNVNNQRKGVYTKEPAPEKTGIEKKMNSIRSGLSFHIPSSNKELNRSKNEVLSSITGEKTQGFIPSNTEIASDMSPKILYHDFYPQNSISYQLNLPEPTQ
jgi:hypothetical protein